METIYLSEYISRRTTLIEHAPEKNVNKLQDARRPNVFLLGTRSSCRRGRAQLGRAERRAGGEQQRRVEDARVQLLHPQQRLDGRGQDRVRVQNVRLRFVGSCGKLANQMSATRKNADKKTCVDKTVTCRRH